MPFAVFEIRNCDILFLETRAFLKGLEVMCNVDGSSACRIASLCDNVACVLALAPAFEEL